MCMGMDLTYTIMWDHCAEHVLTDEDQLRKTTLAQLTPMPDAQAFLDAQAVEPVTTLVRTSAHIKSRTKDRMQKHETDGSKEGARMLRVKH